MSQSSSASKSGTSTGSSSALRPTPSETQSNSHSETSSQPHSPSETRSSSETPSRRPLSQTMTSSLSLAPTQSGTRTQSPLASSAVSMSTRPQTSATGSQRASKSAAASQLRNATSPCADGGVSAADINASACGGAAALPPSTSTGDGHVPPYVGALAAVAAALCCVGVAALLFLRRRKRKEALAKDEVADSSALVEAEVGSVATAEVQSPYFSVQAAAPEFLAPAKLLPPPKIDAQVGRSEPSFTSSQLSLPKLARIGPPVRDIQPLALGRVVKRFAQVNIGARTPASPLSSMSIARGADSWSTARGRSNSHIVRAAQARGRATRFGIDSGRVLASALNSASVSRVDGTDGGDRATASIALAAWHTPSARTPDSPALDLSSPSWRVDLVSSNAGQRTSELAGVALASPVASPSPLQRSLRRGTSGLVKPSPLATSAPDDAPDDGGRFEDAERVMVRSMRNPRNAFSAYSILLQGFEQPDSADFAVSVAAAGKALPSPTYFRASPTSLASPQRNTSLRSQIRTWLREDLQTGMVYESDVGAPTAPPVGSSPVFGGYNVAGFEGSSLLKAPRDSVAPVRLDPSGGSSPSALGAAGRDGDSLDLLFEVAADARRHLARRLFATRAAAGASLRSQSDRPSLSLSRDAPLTATASAPGGLTLASAVAANETATDAKLFVMGPGKLAAARRLGASVSMRALRPSGFDGPESLAHARTLGVASRVERMRASPAPSELPRHRSPSPGSRLEGAVGPPPLASPLLHRKHGHAVTTSVASQGEHQLRAVASRRALLSDTGTAVIGDVFSPASPPSPHRHAILPLSSASHVLDDEHGGLIPGAFAEPAALPLAASRTGTGEGAVFVAAAVRTDRSSPASQAVGPHGSLSPLRVRRMQRPSRSPIAASVAGRPRADGVAKTGGRGRAAAASLSTVVAAAAAAARPGKMQRTAIPETIKRSSSSRRVPPDRQPLPLLLSSSWLPAPAASVASTNRRGASQSGNTLPDNTDTMARSGTHGVLRSDVRRLEPEGSELSPTASIALPLAGHPLDRQGARYGGDIDINICNYSRIGDSKFISPAAAASAHGLRMPVSPGTRSGAADEIDGVLDLLQHF